MLITYDQLMGVGYTLEVIGVKLIRRERHYYPKQKLWFLKPYRFSAPQPIDSIFWGSDYSDYVCIVFGQYYSRLSNANDFVFVNTSKESVEKELQNYRLLG